MTSKQTFKNQELFSFVFMDETFTNPNQFKIHLNSNFREDITKDIEENKQVKLDPAVYAEYELSMNVGKQFFYFAFIHVFSYKKRIEFLEYQLSQVHPDRRLSFLYRVESFANVDYWYSFGEYSYYNSDTEKIVMQWVIDRYLGKTLPPSPLKIVKK